ncbi:unnamed protein product, partial [Heterobilharzia americana]
MFSQLYFALSQCRGAIGTVHLLVYSSVLYVISLSVSAAIILSDVEWWEAVIVLSVTAGIFIVAAFTGLTSKNVSRRGQIVFISISGGLYFVGLIIAFVSYLVQELTIAAGTCWSLALAM